MAWSIPTFKICKIHGELTEDLRYYFKTTTGKRSFRCKSCMRSHTKKYNKSEKYSEWYQNKKNTSGYMHMKAVNLQRSRDELQDCYINRLLRERGLPTDNNLLREVYRAILQLKRAVKKEVMINE